jgi:2-(1,2-epoxy-1,2-dihydrophenyl)acetyl-CoA isomerase
VRRELVERLYAGLAAGDRDAVEALLDPEFVATFAAGLPFGIGGTHRGSAAIDRGWWAIGRAFALRAEPTEWIDCTDGRLLVLGRYVGHARATGATITAAYTHLFAGDGGRLTSLIQLTDSALWLAALGEPRG